MANGEDQAFHPQWCKERHERIQEQFKSVWGEYGIKGLKNRMDKIELRLFQILLGLGLNLIAVIGVLVKVAL